MPLCCSLKLKFSIAKIRSQRNNLKINTFILTFIFKMTFCFYAATNDNSFFCLLGKDSSIIIHAFSIIIMHIKLQ